MGDRLRILVINGPNINLLGKRQPEFYGTLTWMEIETALSALAEDLGVQLEVIQSNHEGNLVDYLDEHGAGFNGLIINPAAFTINGYALLEAILSFQLPFIEVHLSNIYARGGWHSQSIFAPHSLGQICGLKKDSYLLALRGLVNYLKLGQ